MVCEEREEYGLEVESIGSDSDSDSDMDDFDDDMSDSEEEDYPMDEDEAMEVEGDDEVEDLDVAPDEDFMASIAHCTTVAEILHYERLYKNRLNRELLEMLNHAVHNIENRPPAIPLTAANMAIIAAPPDPHPDVIRIDAYWAGQDQTVHARRVEHLWNYALQATRELQKKTNVVIQPTKPTPEFLVEYEAAITTLMDGVERPDQTWVTAEVSRKYEDDRVELLKKVAVQYHNFKKQRPGWQHSYGILFPVQLSYDTIEYLIFASDKADMNCEKQLEETTFCHPEYDEVHRNFHNHVNKVFIMDPCFRREFVQLVKQLHTNDGLVLEESEERAVTGLFDQLNNMFHMTFEHFVMDVAELKRKRDALKNPEADLVALTNELTAAEQIFDTHWNTTDFPA